MGVFYILFFIIIVLLFPIRWIITFSKNKSKIKFNLNKENETNFREIYSELAEEHDNIYRKTKKIIFIIGPLLILSFISLFFIRFNIMFIIICIVSILSYAIIAAITNKKNNRMKLYVKYIKILYKDIIFKHLNVIDYKYSELEELLELEQEEEFGYEEKTEYEEYNKNQEAIIKEVMKKTKKKYYENFSINFDLDCEIKNKAINIKKFANYMIIIPGDNESTIYSFIGHIITIAEFTNIQLLNLSKEDYYYDEKNNILYLIISDEAKNFFEAIIGNKRSLNYNKPFDKCNWLQIKYNYYIQLRNLIERLV